MLFDNKGYLIKVCHIHIKQYFYLWTEGTAPKLIDDLLDQTIISHDKAVLQCKINLGEPKAEVHWYREGKEVYKTKKYEMSEEGEEVTLFINETEPGDGGAFKCEAVNKLGSIKTQCNVVVYSMCISMIHSLCISISISFYIILYYIILYYIILYYIILYQYYILQFIVCINI